MKKTLIALVAFAMAIGVHAATLNWQTYTEDLDYNGGQAYLVLVENASTFAVADDLTITGGSVIDNASIADGTAAGSYNAPATQFTDGTKYLFAIVVTSDGTGATLPSSGTYSLDRNGDNSTGSGFYEMTWNGNTGGGIAADPDFVGVPLTTPVAVPEPTSVALIALGLAALGMKRKVA